MPLPPATIPRTPPSPSPAARSTNLNRDELQGVIAHEFSHVLNGDMRLNIAPDRLAVRPDGRRHGRALHPAPPAARGRQQEGRRRDRGGRGRGIHHPDPRLDRPVLRPPDPGGGVAQARIARRRFRDPVHARPAGPARRAGQDRRAWRGLAFRRRRRGGGRPPAVRLRARRGLSRRIRRSSTASARSIRASRRKNSRRCATR